MTNSLIPLRRSLWPLAWATGLLLAVPTVAIAESTDVIDTADAGPDEDALDVGPDDVAPDAAADTGPGDIGRADVADAVTPPSPDVDRDTFDDVALDAPVPDDTSDGSDSPDATLPGDADFDAIAPGGPVLSTVEPPSARRGGTVDVVLFGFDLLTTDQWRVGSVPIFDLRVLDEGTRLAGVFDSESLAAGTYDITIARDGQLIGGLPGAFRLTDDTEPELTFRIDSVDPPLVRVGNVVELTVTGEGFLPGATVLIDGFVLDETTLRDDTRLEALALPDSFPGPGLYGVTVRQEDGREITLPDAITAIAARPPKDEGCSAVGAGATWTLAWGLVVLGLVRRRRPLAPVA